MQTSDRSAFRQMMQQLGELYDNKIITVSLLDMYFGLLEGYTIEQVTAAASAHCVDPDRGTWFPKPADIVRNIKKSPCKSSDCEGIHQTTKRRLSNDFKRLGNK
jgi:hypothetical protein